MSHSTVRALLLMLLFTFGACSKDKDPTLQNRAKDAALQTTLDELTRLASYTEAGLNYAEYSDRLLNTKGNIDVALRRTADQRAKDKLEHAVTCYLDARNEWKKKIDDNHYSGLGVQYYWAKGAAATRRAAEYAFADDSTRQQIDAREEADPKEALRKSAEEDRAEREATQKEEQAEKERQVKETEAKRKRMAEDAERERVRVAEDAERERVLAIRERIRRFASDGTVFNLKSITIPIEDGLTSIPPGTELKVVKKLRMACYISRRVSCMRRCRQPRSQTTAI